MPQVDNFFWWKWRGCLRFFFSELSTNKHPKHLLRKRTAGFVFSLSEVAMKSSKKRWKLQDGNFSYGIDAEENDRCCRPPKMYLKTPLLPGNFGNFFLVFSRFLHQRRMGWTSTWGVCDSVMESRGIKINVKNH